MKDRSSTILLIVLLAVMTCLPLLHSGYTTTDDAYIALGLQEGQRMSGTRRRRAKRTSSARLHGIPHAAQLRMGQLLGDEGARTRRHPEQRRGYVRGASGVDPQRPLSTLAVVFFFRIRSEHLRPQPAHGVSVHLDCRAGGSLVVGGAWWLALQGRKRLRLVSLALFGCGLFVYENFLDLRDRLPAADCRRRAAGPGPSARVMRRVRLMSS